MHVISGSFHMLLVILGGGEEEKTSDGGTLLVGKVCHLAAYATALTHSLQPICRDAEPGYGCICLLPPKDGTAGREKLTAETAKPTWKRRADTEGKEDPEAG